MPVPAQDMSSFFVAAAAAAVVVVFVDVPALLTSQPHHKRSNQERAEDGRGKRCPRLCLMTSRIGSPVERGERREEVAKRRKGASCLTVCDLSSFHFISSSGV